MFKIKYCRPNSGKIETKDRNAISVLHAITEKLQLKIEGGGGCLGYLQLTKDRKFTEFF